MEANCVCFFGLFNFISSFQCTNVAFEINLCVSYKKQNIETRMHVK